MSADTVDDEPRSPTFLDSIEFLTGEDPNLGSFLLVVGIVTCVFIALFQFTDLSLNVAIFFVENESREHDSDRMDSESRNSTTMPHSAMAFVRGDIDVQIRSRLANALLPRALCLRRSPRQTVTPRRSQALLLSRVPPNDRTQALQMLGPAIIKQLCCSTPGPFQREFVRRCGGRAHSYE